MHSPFKISEAFLRPYPCTQGTPATTNWDRLSREAVDAPQNHRIRKLDPIVSVIHEDIQEHWSQYCLLRDTTCH